MSFTNKSMVAAVASLFLGSSLFVGAVRAADEKKPPVKPATESKADEKGKPKSDEKSKADDKSKPAAKDDDAKADKGGDAKSADKNVKVTKPWSDLALTDEQKSKIRAIHGKALAEKNAIEKQERSDIEALLTDEQKTELAALKTKTRKDAAEKRAEKKDKDQPAEAKAEEKKAE